MTDFWSSSNLEEVFYLASSNAGSSVYDIRQRLLQLLIQSECWSRLLIAAVMFTTKPWEGVVKVVFQPLLKCYSIQTLTYFIILDRVFSHLETRMNHISQEFPVIRGQILTILN